MAGDGYMNYANPHSCRDGGELLTRVITYRRLSQCMDRGFWDVTSETDCQECQDNHNGRLELIFWHRLTSSGRFAMYVCNASSVDGCGLLDPVEAKLAEVEPGLMPAMLRVALAAIMIFMITIGFLGNAIVCLIVYQKPAMRSAINLLLATLAFSDIMLSLLCMPFTAVTVATTDWGFGAGFCRVTVMLYWLFVLEGVSILLIISVDRFLIIVQRQDKLTPHRAKILIASSWALSFCVSLPSVVGWRTAGMAEGAPQCILGYSDSLADRGYTVLLAVAVFFVPFSVMLYSYLCILNTVRRNTLRIHNHTTDGSVGLNHVSKLGLTGLQRPPQVNVDMSFKTRAFTTILILFIGFSVCWLPHTVVSLLAVFSRQFYFSPAFYPVSVGALWLSYLKAVFNPVIYCWRIRKFREACLDFMPKTCRICPKVPGRSRRRIRPSNIYVCSSETQSSV